VGYTVTIKRQAEIVSYVLKSIDDTRPLEGDNTPHEIDRSDAGYGRFASDAARFCNRV
jgi:hypothetical protein